MKKLLCVIASLMVVVASGCRYSRHYIDDMERQIPKRPNWSLKTESPDPEGLICYDCIYVAEITKEDLFFGGEYLFDVFRFYESGHVALRSFIDQQVSFDDLKTFEYSLIGYFKVVNGRLLIETYALTSGSSYTVREAVFTENGFVVLSTRDERQLFQREYDYPDFEFRKEQVDIEFPKPDW